MSIVIYSKLKFIFELRRRTQWYIISIKHVTIWWENFLLNITGKVDVKCLFFLKLIRENHPFLLRHNFNPLNLLVCVLFVPDSLHLLFSRKLSIQVDRIPEALPSTEWFRFLWLPYEEDCRLDLCYFRDLCSRYTSF